MYININFDGIIKLVHLGLTSNKNNRFITYICKHILKLVHLGLTSNKNNRFITYRCKHQHRVIKFQPTHSLYRKKE